MGLGRPSAALNLIDRAAHPPPVVDGFPGKRLPQRRERLLRAQGRRCGRLVEVRGDTLCHAPSRSLVWLMEEECSGGTSG